jgi:acetyltransferase-like isoleucine patch superfamily enzyme
VRIATDVILETAHPEWISIGSDVQIGVRTTILAHIHALRPDFDSVEERERYKSVVIGDEVNIGPGSLILPNVTIGRGAVVAAGSVVSTVVPERTMVRGNPAVPVARCGISLSGNTTMKEFMRNLSPIAKA